MLPIKSTLFSRITIRLVIAAGGFFLPACANLGSGSSTPGIITDKEAARIATLKAEAPKSKRPSKLPSPNLVVNAAVKKHLNKFSKQNVEFLRASIKRREELYPSLKQILDDEGVPEEILNVAFIESGFESNARSHAGAVGMWQFMKSTAKIYGLAVNLFEDERKDPILSTIAAARYLRDLYDNYKDWHLALAAYNAGEGAIDRAIKRAGKDDFWSLVKKGKLTRETADFVPKFIAATILVKNLNIGGEDADKQIAYWSGDRYTPVG